MKVDKDVAKAVKVRILDILETGQVMRTNYDVLKLLFALHEQSVKDGILEEFTEEFSAEARAEEAYKRACEEYACWEEKAEERERKKRKYVIASSITCGMAVAMLIANILLLIFG